MRRIAPLVCSILGLLPLVVCLSARADKEIAAEPETIAPGKTVTLRWYFTGEKVVISGGRFGKGVVVTGRSSLTDTPQKTTRYTFDVDYYPKENPPASNDNKTEKPAPRKLVHVQYTVVVEVVVPAPIPPMTTYKDPHGWQVNYVSGWQRDVSTPDEGDKGLIFFQKEYDSVERMAVAVMPANDRTLGAILEKVKSDVYANYTQVKVTEPQEIALSNLTAQWLTFAGMDTHHPGTRTQSVVLAVIRDGRAYVISARTNADTFKARQGILEKMVKSFGFSSGRAEDFQPHLRRTSYRSPNEV